MRSSKRVAIEEKEMYVEDEEKESVAIEEENAET